MSGMDHISGILRTVLRRRDLETGVENYSVFPRWAAIVGDPLAATTRPLRVHGTTLWVYVETAVLQHHLSFLVPKMLERLRQVAPGSTIDNIRFTPNPEP
jgi:hypothetical protein